MTLGALVWTWGLLFAVCAVGCLVARLVGQRLDEAEAKRSRRQWRRMCDAIEAEDLADSVHQRADQRPGDRTVVTTASASGRPTGADSPG